MRNWRPSATAPNWRDASLAEFALLGDRRSCYSTRMTKEQVKEVLDRVLTWPAERQADVVHIVELMEEQDKTELRLSDEQVAEIRRRLADPNPKFLTLEEVRERFARRRA